MRKFYSILILMLTFCSIASSQVVSQWTWISGDNILDQPAIYGTKGTPDPTSKPGARHGAVSWTDVSGNLWLFGGLGFGSSGQGFLNDLWKYNPLSGEWTWISGDNTINEIGVYGTRGVPSPTNKPGARFNAVSWTDAEGNLWLMGGLAQDGIGSNGQLNDLWKYNPTTNQWTWVSGGDTINQLGIYGTKGVPSNAVRPGARSGAVSWTDASGNLWLFGGSGYTNNNFRIGQLNDLWRYNPTSNQWTWVSGDNTLSEIGVYGTRGIPATANKPGARTNAVSWTDAEGNLWLMSGLGFANSSNNSINGYLNDLWKYNPSTAEWTWVSGDNTLNQPGTYGTKGIPSGTNKPGGRRGAVSWKDNSGNLWLMGGTAFASIGGVGQLNDLWKYNPNTNQWTWVSGDNIFDQAGIYSTKGTPDPTNKPGVRRGSVSWTDAAGNLWLFGGISFASSNTSNGLLNDLWKYAVIVEPSIITDLLSPTACAGSSLNIGFTIKGTFNAGNVFTAEISDASGSFANPVAIGTLASAASGFIKAILPANIKEGRGYRIRVVSSSPVVTGTDNGTNIVINTTTAIITSSGGGSASSLGLAYKYFEGMWTSLPDFGGLTPVASGSTPNASLAPRKRDDHFAFLWEGFITVPAGGTYTFETASDDGSRLYIGEYGHHVSPVVNNDGQHAEQLAGGSYTFPAAGTYPIAITYFEAGGAETMKVYWTAPAAGIPSRTLIPDAAFSHLNYNPGSPGLRYKYYEGMWTALPDFSSLTPVASGTIGGVSIAPKRRDDHFAFLWEGKIFIPKAGTYYFETRSDDGSKLYIGEYGHGKAPVVDNDGQHAMQFRGGWYTFPAAGAYPIAITFFEAGGSEGIEVYWTAPHANIHTRTLIPNRAFREVLGGGNVCAAGVTLTASEGDSYLWSTGETTRSITVRQNGSYSVTVMQNGCQATDTTTVSCEPSVSPVLTQKGQAQTELFSTTFLSLQASPNPSSGPFTVRVSGVKKGSPATLIIIDALGRVVEKRTLSADGQFTLGADYRTGLYHVQLLQGAKKTTIKVVRTGR